jgi:hypothetical protein
MRRRRARQLQLGLEARPAQRVPKDKERELVEALAEMLLAAAREESGDEGRGEDECQDHG